jgi:alkylated DNA repair dioxygenase AlkB
VSTVIHSAQGALFDAADGLPQGLTLAPTFIDAAEEHALLEVAATLPLHEARYKQYTARRRVFAYGSRADYEEDRLRPVPIGELPAALHRLRERLAAWVGVAPEEFVHVMIAQYQKGTPLGWHRDAPYYELVCGVSLGSPARLRFRPWQPRDPKKEDIVTIELAPRSAYAMRGAARWGWQHSVPPVPRLRHSVTMRTARN